MCDRGKYYRHGKKRKVSTFPRPLRADHTVLLDLNLHFGGGPTHPTRTNVIGRRVDPGILSLTFPASSGNQRHTFVCKSVRGRGFSSNRSSFQTKKEILLPGNIRHRKGGYILQGKLTYHGLNSLNGDQNKRRDGGLSRTLPGIVTLHSPLPYLRHCYQCQEDM